MYLLLAVIAASPMLGSVITESVISFTVKMK